MCGRRRICCISRHRPASKFQRAISIVPATGLHSDRNTVSEGYLQSKEPPKLRSFLNFLSSVSGCRKMPPKAASYLDRKAILLRARARRKVRSLSFPAALSRGICFWVSLAALLLPPLSFSRCGNHLEILWEAIIDRIFRRTVCL